MEKVGAAQCAEHPGKRREGPRKVPEGDAGAAQPAKRDTDPASGQCLDRRGTVDSV